MTCSTSKSIIRRIGLTIPLFLFIAGCGPSQEEMMAKDRLEQARVVYRQAKADPNVTGAAQIPLMDAEKKLQAAETAPNYIEKEHLAYLSSVKSKTAVVVGEGKAADNELDQLQKESNETILKKKEREIKNREQETAEKGRKLEKANAEIETARGETKQARGETEQARAQNAELMKEVAELNGKLTNRGVVLTLGDVIFATGKSDLSPAANTNLDRLAQFLVKYPDRNLTITGHTDNVGSDSYNDALSERRAESVKMALVEKGVGAERITAKGLGKRYPVASNSTAHGRQLNRRVEVEVLNKGEKPESQ